MTDIASLGIKVTTDGVQQAADSLDKMAASGDKAAASVDKLSKASAAASKYSSPQYRQQADDLAKLVGQIDPAVAALDRLDKQQAKLAAFKKQGLVSDDDFARFSKTIDDSRAKITAAGESVHNFSLNNANARRELGYLAKDLATGQWDRFQQSFATLASSSGLLGLAFSATGAAIAAIAAPIALFVAGAIKGYQENEKLRTSLIATGQAAGVSAAGLTQMANAVGEQTHHWSDARKAIEDFTASGKVAGAGIGGLAEEAVNMSTVTGQSIDKTVSKIIELGEKPSETIAKLNEQYHFLTGAQYEHIAALEEEGRVQDAARLANASLNEEMAKRAQEVESNAGWIVKSARWVGDEWNKAWAAVKHVGAPDSLADQVATIEAAIEKLQQVRTDRQGNLVQAGGTDELNKLKAQLADLRKQQFDEGLAGVNKSLDDQANSASIAAQRRLASFATPKEKLDSQIKKANEDRLAALYGVVDKDAVARINAQADQQIKDAQDAYNSAMRKDRPKDDDIDAQVLARKNLQDAIKKGIEIDKQQLDQWARGVVTIANYKAAMEDKLKTDQAAIDLQVAAVSMGKQQVALQREIIQAQAEADKQLEQLNRDFADKSRGITQDQYNEQLNAIKDFEAKRIAQISKGNADIIAAQGDWKNGMVGAIDDFEERAANVAGSTRSLFTTAFDGIGQAFADFVTKGKLSFSDLANSIISDLIKIETRILVSQALQSIFGSFTPGTDNLALAGINGQISRNTTAMNWTPNANGGVYASASLSAFSGTVVDKPTIFAFAKGAGLMGEAGPEAILPLTRGSNGKLGVQSSGNAGTQVEVNITNNGQAVQAQQTGTRMDGNKVIVDLVLSAVAQDIQRGGRVAQATQQRFGVRQRGISVAGA